MPERHDLAVLLANYEATRRLINDRRLEEKEKFVSKFEDTILSPYVSELFDYMHDYAPDVVDATIVELSKKGIIERVRANLELAKFIKSLSTKKVIHTSEYHIEDNIDILHFHQFAYRLLFQNLDSPYKELRAIAASSPLIPLSEKWANSISKLPNTSTTNYLEGEEWIIMPPQLEDMISSMEQFLSETRQLITITQNSRADDLLRKALELGVPRENRYFRELYRCLRHFNLVEDSQATSHDASTSRDVKEQFVQKKIKRIIENANNTNRQEGI